MGNYLELATLMENIDEINKKFNVWTDKLTSNSVVASFLTIGLFLIVCIAIKHYASK